MVMLNGTLAEIIGCLCAAAKSRLPCPPPLMSTNRRKE